MKTPQTPVQKPKVQHSKSKRPKNWLGKENAPTMDVAKLR